MLPDALTQKDITTERLRLRRLRPGDAGLLSLYASDERVARMTMRIPHPYPPGQAEAFIQRMLSGSTSEIVWALDRGADDENGLMGLVSLRPSGSDSADISYWVAPAFWGTGYASEAVRTICTIAPDWGVSRITAQVFQDNGASIRVLLRAGFTHTGEGETHCIARNAMVPTFTYARDCGGI